MHWLNPDHLPKVVGTVDRFLINLHGQIDGILLTDEMEVHLPPHLSDQVRAAVTPGSSISIFGVRPREAEMIVAVAIETGSGHRIVDNGPPKEKHGDKPQHLSMEVQGVVQRSLHGPKGEARGALLEDGRIVRVPPHEARQREALLRPGARLAARGPGLTVNGATVIDAKELGTSMASLEPVTPKEPKDKEKPLKAPKHA